MRSRPGLRLRPAAAFAGCSPDLALLHLSGPLRRGRCAELATAAAVTGNAAAARHQACPPGVTALVASEGTGAARDTATLSVLSGPAWFANSRYFAIRPSSAQRQSCVSGPAAAPALITAIAAADDRSDVLAACAASPACPPCLLGMLAGHPDRATREAAAANPACPPFVLACLARVDGAEANR